MRVLTIALLLAACGQPSPTSDGSAASATPPSRTAQETSATRVERAARAFTVKDANDLYEFEYAWPAEAAAIPQLVARFRRDMEKVKAELASGAKADRDQRSKSGFDFHPHAAMKSYETAGQSQRLLSLKSTVYGFTGGAHGSTGSGALLWDRRQAREIGWQDLVRPGRTWTGAIRQPFCVLLDREREKRRQEPVKPDDLFGNCPELKELTVLLTDTDRNARFDHVTVIADQYVAGPYAEGPYEIALPITARMIERLRPEFAESFESRPPVR